MPQVAGTIFVVLLVVLVAVGGLSTAMSSVRGWFSPNLTVINATTPFEMKLKSLYMIQADGPFRVVMIDKAGVTRTTNYNADGSYISGNHDTLSYEDWYLQEHVERVESLDPSRQEHVTLRECRIQEKWFHNELVCK